MLFKGIWREINQQTLLKFLPTKLPGENSVQIVPDFPAKSLCIYMKNFP